jgi:hypothetical protein
VDVSPLKSIVSSLIVPVLFIDPGHFFYSGDLPLTLNPVTDCLARELSLEQTTIPAVLDDGGKIIGLSFDDEDAHMSLNLARLERGDDVEAEVDISPPGDDEALSEPAHGGHRRGRPLFPG